MSFIAKDIIRLHGFKVGLDKDAVSLPILRALLKGWYEGAEVGLIEKVLKPGDKVIELGTGIGITSMTAARIVGAKNVCTHELNPYLVAWAQDNFARNDLALTVMQEALLPRASMPEGYIDFHVHKDFWSSSLVKRDGIQETIQVPVVCLEDKIATFGANTLIIDIEGAEVSLFETLDLAGIEKIILEIHYKSAGRQPTNQMIGNIQAAGYFLDYELITDGVLCFTRQS
ncbi:MAG: FkbM family methyltransferase [Alphaproteobacteria bacterium]|nr:FkbM family methyltransferase [Alphaproteobacteria bacterium]